VPALGLVPALRLALGDGPPNDEGSADDDGPDDGDGSGDGSGDGVALGSARISRQRGKLA
jgi:hypothetical protein